MKTITISLLPLVLILLHKTLAADSLYATGKTPATRHYNAVNRFPHLQRVADRIESVSRHHHPTPAPVSHYQHHFARASTPPVTDLATLAPKHLRPASAAEHQPKRHSHDYDEEDDDDEDEEEDEEEEEDEDEDEDEGDGDRAKDPRNVQTLPHGRSPWGSRVTTTTPRSRPVAEPKPTMSSYSNFKWDILGRKKPLDEFRNTRLNLSKGTSENAEENRLAGQHAVRAGRETICKVPRPKVIHVKDVHPHPSKSYLPPCIVLHQCGADTGCCYGDTHTCVARATHQVVLYFHSTLHFGASPTSAGGRRYPQSTGHAVEKLIFHNHTECSCQNKHEELMPRDMDAVSSSKNQPQLAASAAAAAAAAPAYQRPQQQRQYHRPQETPSARSFSSKTCRCPVEYAIRVLEDDTCSCECFDKQRDCLRLKEGKDYFAHGDKLCIEKGHCHPPSCEYGVYNRMAGRCPRRQDQPTSTWSHYPSTTRHNNF